MENRPNLFIIGASKCGTTSLWNKLDQHSQVFMSHPKEPRFFSFSDYKNRIDWYLSLFSKVSEEKIIGEASPIYSETTLIPELPKRIYDFNENAKIIYIVREPIDRLKSVYRQTLSSGHWQEKKYKKYTDTDVSLMPKAFNKAVYKYPPFIEATKYWTHLNNYRTYFKDEQILLLFFEDLKSDPEKVYLDLCEFLDIEPELSKDLFKKKNPSKGKVRDYYWIGEIKKLYFFNFIDHAVKRITGNRLPLPKKIISYSIDIKKNEREKILEELNKEIEQILKYGQKPPDYWN